MLYGPLIFGLRLTFVLQTRSPTQRMSNEDREKLRRLDVVDGNPPEFAPPDRTRIRRGVSPGTR